MKVLTPLLSWRSGSGIAMELSGRAVTQRQTFGPSASSHPSYQWLKEVEIARDGITVLRAVAQDPSRSPTYGLVGDLSADDASHEAAPLEVELDGVPVPLSHLAGGVQRRSRRAALTVSLSGHGGAGGVDSGHQRKLRVEASTLELGKPHKPEAGLLLELVSARAAKFDAASHADAARYHHLNLHLVSGVPAGATGAFAELAGSQPMSTSVRALLRRPMSARRSSRRRRRSRGTDA